jgi:hypothetical protein
MARPDVDMLARIEQSVYLGQAPIARDDTYVGIVEQVRGA